MRVQSEEHHAYAKKANLTEEESKASSQIQVRVRNVQLLIQDVFKQFDHLFNDLASKQQLEAIYGRKPSQESSLQGIHLGELSLDSVQSLTDLLYLPSIDKKLLAAMGDFLFRMSNLKDAEVMDKN